MFSSFPRSYSIIILDLGELDMQEIFVKRLIELMENANMTQIELAQKIGTTNVTISRYLSGERSPRIEILTQIAKVFNVSIDYLLGLPISKSNHFIENESIIDLYKIVSRLGFLDNEHKLSKNQIILIKKLLDANKDFILPLKNDGIIENQEKTVI